MPFQAWQLCPWEQHPAVAVPVSLLRSLYCPPYHTWKDKLDLVLALKVCQMLSS